MLNVRDPLNAKTPFSICARGGHKTNALLFIFLSRFISKTHGTRNMFGLK